MAGTFVSRRGRGLIVLVTAAGMAAATLAAGGGAAQAAGPAATPPAAGDYVVTLVAPPAAGYGGGVAGLAATRAAEGDRMATRDAKVTRYRSHLLQSQAKLLRDAGVRPRAQYTMSLNGFSARLTAAQAAKLAGSREVLSVSKDTLRKPQLFDTPRFIGLSGPSGGWAQAGGQDKAGRGVVVGVLDTGIWPENPFFAGSPVKRTSPGGSGSVYRGSDGKLHVVRADGGEFAGTCQTGENFGAGLCNSKLVGARYYDAGFGAGLPRDQWSEFEFRSPRDGDGHGSHTASTAAGNPLRGMTSFGRTFGASSGMAPAAKVAAYKVCWEAADADLSGCKTSDILQAIDDAVADGVDVINFSIGGTTPSGSDDPTELAFLNAAAAGVFVAASAGNSGPGASTADHNSPWLTSVAASTAHRLEGTVQLGDGTKLRGASWSTTPVPATPAVLGSASAAAGQTAANAGLCIENSLDPAKVAGKIVVCDRGVNDRVAKSAEVKRAGGVGLVLTNPSENTVNADTHAVPTVHLSHLDRPKVLAYLATANPTVALLVGDQTGQSPTPLPQVAGFSSRGPDLTSGGDLVKPDITAPGVDIVAAVAPGPNAGNLFGPLSGTSMAAPHVAGLAAVILGKRPGWSPAAVKSAMMTTASNLRNADGSRNANPFDGGAGQVDARDFLDPGLVYDAGILDWLGFLEGQGLDTGTGLEPVDGSDLNLPSIGVGQLAGKQTVTRTVTAVRGGTYRASVSRLPGIRTVVTPSTLKLKKGQSAGFTVTFTRTSAALDAYSTGFLTWSSGQTSVRSPIAVKPVAVSAPEEVSGTGTSGSVTYPIGAGTTGSLPLGTHGLTAGQVTPDSVAVGALNPTPAGDAANKVYAFTVPAGTTLARFETKAEDDADDLDLFVFDADFGLVDQSATSSADERVTVRDLPAGTYYVVVNGYASTDGQPVGYDFRSFLVPGAAAGNLTVSPNPVPTTLGRPANVTATWSGLTAGTPYLGWFGYGDTAVRTVVSIG